MWIIIVLGLIALILAYVYRNTRYYQLASALPCAKAPPLIGHAFTFWVEKNEILDKMLELLAEEENDRILRTHGILSAWIGPMVVVLVDNLDDIEQIMVSRELTTKAYQYKFFEPWLGQGLLTSSGTHWYNHRKLITPAFHFSILEKFIPVFNSNIEIYLKKLEKKAGNGLFNIEYHVAYLSLDIIAETAMSTKINAQVEESEYAQKLKDLTETIIIRAFRLLYYPDFIFNLSTVGKRHKKNKEFMDNFINKVVNMKKKEKENIDRNKNENDEIGCKTKVALMDLLLDTQKRTTLLTDKDILDELHTFMFGGHDTITSGINFTLYLLSRHQAIQDEVLKEILDVVGEEKFTLTNLQELKYLERVIKESLRILPVAPFVIRAVTQETKLRSGFVLPAGSSIIVFMYRLHRDPRIFPEPDKFDPDRFLPENCAGRHPYAYLPFSAGPRNCIGQKFAMLEMKAIIAATVRRFKLLPSGEEIKPIVHIILRSANGINLKLEERNNNQ